MLHPIDFACMGKGTKSIMKILRSDYVKFLGYVLFNTFFLNFKFFYLITYKTLYDFLTYLPTRRIFWSYKYLLTQSHMNSNILLINHILSGLKKSLNYLWTCKQRLWRYWSDLWSVYSSELWEKYAAPNSKIKIREPFE